jgi:hypothetical protein
MVRREEGTTKYTKSHEKYEKRATAAVPVTGY